MRKRKPQQATLDEVSISRDGEDAIIEFRDTNVATTHLRLGPEVQSMTDREILGRFNDVMLAQQQMAAAYEHVAVEVPPGNQQIEHDERCDQWVSRGDVLRCVIEDSDGQAVVHIDDHELSIDEFGRLLVTHAGWGMRIVFVPNDEIEQLPQIEVREPEGGDALDSSGG